MPYYFVVLSTYYIQKVREWRIWTNSKKSREEYSGSKNGRKCYEI